MWLATYPARIRWWVGHELISDHEINILTYQCRIYQSTPVPNRLVDNFAVVIRVVWLGAALRRIGDRRAMPEVLPLPNFAMDDVF
jgi:hypothetical protein